MGGRDFQKKEKNEARLANESVNDCDDNMINQPTEWLLPCNLKYYSLKEALIELKKIDWRYTNRIKNARVGDLVYLYCIPRKGKASIWYKGVILEINKWDHIIDDSKFSASGTVSNSPCFTVVMFRKYDSPDERLSYVRLVEAGLKAKPMSALPVRGDLAEYLHACDWLQLQLEENSVIPDECIDIKELSGLVDEHFDTSPFPEIFAKREAIASSLSTEKLRRIVEKRGTKTPREVVRSVMVRERCEAVSVLAKRRANGICQLCGAPAPFVNSDGKPYLETHHIEWLSKGGEDSEENTVALCPNCHRKMHVLNNPDDVKYLKELIKKR